MCSKGFEKFCQLRTHYTLVHYWDKLKRDLGHLGNKCTICIKSYPTDDHLVQHMGNFHSKVDVYVQEDFGKELILNQERTVRIFNWSCNICKKEFSSGTAVKSHFATVHFSGELKREWNIPESKKNRKCPKVVCNKGFDQGVPIGPVLGHVGSFHDEVLKYAIKYLKMSREDLDFIPVDDFDDDAVGVPYQELDALVRRDLRQCEKCPLKFTRLELKVHYVESHYQEEFHRNFSSLQCIACDLKFKDIRATHKHIVGNHEAFLETILEKDGIQLPTASKKSPMKKTTVAAEEKPFNSNPPICQICFKTFGTPRDCKKHYIVHLEPISHPVSKH